jgi:succinate dehydrogenase/fumarate reductase cytochrome b subunit
MRWTIKRLSAIILAVFLSVGIAAAQCPMCKKSLTESEEGKALVGSLNTAIVLLLAAPFTVIGIVGVAAYRSQKRAREEESL